MNFTANTLSEICTMTATSLKIVFPDQDWTVLPEISPDKGQVGLFIATMKPGTENVVVSRPMVSILTPWELNKHELLVELVGAFQKELSALNTPASEEAAGSPPNPLVPREFVEGAPKRKGRPVGSKNTPKS